MLAYCVYVLKVASIDGPIPFLVACHFTIFIVNLLFCYVLGVSRATGVAVYYRLLSGVVVG